MEENKKIKALLVSNYSRSLTGFGKNMKNILHALYEDSDFEVVEAANGCFFGTDLRTPWRGYGTYPSNPNVLMELNSDPHRKRLAEYGNLTIDEIIKIEKPDIVLGIEDVWAFDWANKKWIDKIPTIIWTTLDSSPILDMAYMLANKVSKFLVWASFAEKEMRDKGCEVETLHGAINLSSFSRLEESKRKELRTRNNLDENFVVGFVFKNQLRKSVPNLLEGFKLFKEKVPNAKLLLHTDWAKNEQVWDIPKYIEEKDLDPRDILATYICESCKKYSIKSYSGEKITCDHCGNQTFVTKSNLFGVTEHELNEIYNIMDVYCHPFTSGGQELPIQEAKAAGLITLVTEYSCGTDSCYPHQGGLPLEWVEYREPYTQFIKATTLPSSIASRLLEVFNMSAEEKEVLTKAGQNYVKENFSVEKIVEKLKNILRGFGKTNWDFDFEDKVYNKEYIPDDSLSNLDWIIDLYKGMFYKDFTLEDVEIQEAIKLIEDESNGGRKKVYDYLVMVAVQKNKEKNKPVDFGQLLDKDKKDRIAIVIPESAGDVLMVNSLVRPLKKLYPEKDIYFITSPQYFPMINGHPDIYKILPFKQGMDNLLFLEGQGDHEGYFEIAHIPAVGSQKFLSYLHSGKDKNVFGLP